MDHNYPNPFNPSTTIEFSLPTSNHVVLKVYDVLGKEILTLVDETLAAGQHQVHFDARHLASGVYFYKIQAGDFTRMKKMVLMQ
ncbi:T9SS type A sorting domain-containing protein [candidate division KSB1 bacterium]|nr:T9SS type A sorting domain-containing protein [candidate division KSB1 bacterium]